MTQLDSRRALQLAGGSSLRLFGAVAAVGRSRRLHGRARGHRDGAAVRAHHHDRPDRAGARAVRLHRQRDQQGFKLYLDDHGYLLGRHRVDLRVGRGGGDRRGRHGRRRGPAQPGRARAGRRGQPSVAERPSPPQVAGGPGAAGQLARRAGDLDQSQLYIWRASYVEGEAGLAPGAVRPHRAAAATSCTRTRPNARAEAKAFRPCLHRARGRHRRRRGRRPVPRAGCRRARNSAARADLRRVLGPGRGRPASRRTGRPDSTSS